MKRNLHIQPGYCDLGVRGEEWRYSVVADDGLTALNLIVRTAMYPATATRAIGLAKSKPIEERVYGATLSLCCAFPTNKETLLVENWGDECTLVGRCTAFGVTYTGAHEFIKKYGNPNQSEQYDEFWTALEARCVEMSAQAHMVRVDLKFEKCECCSGTGIVERKDVK